MVMGEDERSESQNTPSLTLPLRIIYLLYSQPDNNFRHIRIVPPGAMRREIYPMVGEYQCRIARGRIYRIIMSNPGITLKGIKREYKKDGDSRLWIFGRVGKVHGYYVSLQIVPFRGVGMSSLGFVLWFGHVGGHQTRVGEGRIFTVTVGECVVAQGKGERCLSNNIPQTTMTVREMPEQERPRVEECPYCGGRFASRAPRDQ